MLFGYDVVVAFRFRLSLCYELEFFGEGFVVDEGPGVVEFVVPGSFEILHRLHQVGEFFVADEGEEGGVDAVAVEVVGVVVVAVYSVESP